MTGRTAAQPDTTRDDAHNDDAQNWAGRRADARLNHERVLAAAREVFTEHGIGATIPQVAARAGVGKATVYRSYPTKADLVRALAQQHIEWFHELAATAVAAAHDDAYHALEDLLEQVTARLAQDRLMVEVLSGFEGLDQRLGDRLEELLTLGRRQGSLRADATGMDVQILVSGVARALIELDIRDPQVWRRYARLALAALRPDPAPPIP
ncbi:TetR/AcrR family transcriptional regulator [Nocardia flavorosea]|uniref:TetR/AcrR family transcriptional regulator n=1 Tax=Nocardia flavorosea TaxID=53429 RepID=A0A846YJM3_9NOCA|nr:TetR/AcrR family transcriptional regulator [Nocardia flavorosea]NKY57860.1 TetR/AcrR family transcriptional regulator [Nocardia flavorosea]